MKKNGIRLYYSGFIIFAAQILSVITGLAFTLLLTRNLTKQEYGIWANIFDLVNYFLLLSGIFPFWAIRFIARGKQGAAKTGLLANLVISLISTTLYVSFTPFLTGAFHIGGPYVVMYLIAFAQIINVHLILVFESVLRATKPQAVGYGLLIEETTKLALAYVLIVRLEQLFLGALLSIIVSTTVQVLYYVSITKNELTKNPVGIRKRMAQRLRSQPLQRRRKPTGLNHNYSTIPTRRPRSKRKLSSRLDLHQRNRLLLVPLIRTIS